MRCVRRVPSAAQLNGGHQDQNQPPLPKHLKGYQGQPGHHYSLHINRPASATGMAPATHTKGMSTFASRTPSRTPSRTSSPQGSSERLENGNGLDNMGVTSFMSNGGGHGQGQGNVNRGRSALAQLPPNGSANGCGNGNGASSPHNARWVPHHTTAHCTHLPNSNTPELKLMHPTRSRLAK